MHLRKITMTSALHAGLSHARASEAAQNNRRPFPGVSFRPHQSSLSRVAPRCAAAFPEMAALGSPRLQVIVRINGASLYYSCVVLTWDSRCANSSLRHVRQTSLAFAGKPEGNLSRRGIRRPHLSFDYFVALDRLLFHFAAEAPHFCYRTSILKKTFITAFQ